MKKTNAIMAEENTFFHSCCKCAGIPPTKRQMSKYMMGKGLAIKFKAQAIELEAKKNETN
jgi:hypothetical protein